MMLTSFLAMCFSDQGKAGQKGAELTLEGVLSTLPSLPVDILNTGASPGKVITC